MRLGTCSATVFRWLLTASLLTTMGWGQDAGSIQGTVSDATGARIPNAAVRLLDSGQRPGSSANADAAGEYVFSNLPPGQYAVEIQSDGFSSKVTRGIDVRAGQETVLETILETGMVSETIEVAAAAQLLQPTTSTQSATITSDQLINLPTATRNYTHLIVAEAGVAAPLPDRTGRTLQVSTTPGNQSGDGTASLNPTVNGQRSQSNGLRINGLDATNVLSNSGGLIQNINIPLDAVEAVEVKSSLYSATTGRNAGSDIQLFTKSGGNDFHGAVYHFLQNEQLNANEFFLNRGGTARPQFRRNETGFTFGGPAIKNKTFFFASVARLDFASGYASNAQAQVGLPTGLTDTRTPETIAAAASEWLRTGAEDNPNFAANFLRGLRAFPAEQQQGLIDLYFADSQNLIFRTLSPTDIHPVSINILNAKRDGKFLIPTPAAGLPVLPGNGTYGREILQQQVIPTFFKSWSGTGTLDHNFSDSHRVKLNYSRSSQFIEEAFGWADSSPSPTLGESPTYLASINDTYVISPKLVNTLRGGFQELFNTRISKFRDITNSDLGIYNPLEEAVGGLAALMPTIDINTQRSSGGIGNAWDFFDRQRVLHLEDIVSYTTGKHTMQFGVEARRINVKGEFMSRTNGDLDFNNWVWFMTGKVSASGSSDLDQGDTRRDFLFYDTSFFFQHDWKVRPGLTLNAGLRYDYYGQPREKNGRIGNYYTEEVAQALGVPMGFQVPEQSIVFEPNFDPIQIGLVVEPGTDLDMSMVHPARFSSTLKRDVNNFAPRIGFAYQPRSISNLVVRGGGGVFYERPGAGYKYLIQRAAPFFIYQNVPAPPELSDPYPRLNVNPFAIPLNVTITRDENGSPSWLREDGTPFPTQSPFNAKNNTFIDPFIRTPYTLQWTFNVQYELLKGQVLDTRYVGTRGIGLHGIVNLAQPGDVRVNPVNGFTDIVDNRGALINPDFFVEPRFLGLDSIGGFDQLGNWGHSIYHGWQTNYRLRMGRRASAQVGYTWSKTIDNVSSPLTRVEANGRDLPANRGLSDFDIAHRFTAAYTYELPIPKLQNKALGFVLNGWNLSGFVTLQSGTPFGALGARNQNATFAQPGVARLSWAPGATIEDARGSGRVSDRIDAYYKVDAFVDSLDTWGNTGRNILRGPAQRQFDFMLGKKTRFGEHQEVELRWELFNAFNQATFSNPTNTFASNGPGNAGRITSTIGGPRTMQFGLRYSF